MNEISPSYKNISRQSFVDLIHYAPAWPPLKHDLTQYIVLWKKSRVEVALYLLFLVLQLKTRDRERK